MQGVVCHAEESAQAPDEGRFRGRWDQPGHLSGHAVDHRGSSRDEPSDLSQVLGLVSQKPSDLRAFEPADAHACAMELRRGQRLGGVVGGAGRPAERAHACDDQDQAYRHDCREQPERLAEERPHGDVVGPLLKFLNGSGLNSVR